MPHYDIIIAGSGAAGLSLAYHLVRSPLRDRSILLIDQDAKERNDRTWCFWARRPTLFDDIVHRSWNRLLVAGEGFSTALDLGAYRYQMVRGIDFYHFARQAVATQPNVEFLRGHVDRIDDGEQGARVLVDGRTYAATWVFDSLFRWPRCRPDRAHYHSLRQQFTGWEIETPHAVFDPRVPTLLDFRTPQPQGLRFLYVLPLSVRQALVEYVLCGPVPSRQEACERAVRTYLSDVLRLDEYRIVREEHGITPLTDWPFPRRAGAHIMTVGVKGGRIKPSAGYAFTRMQQDAAAIVRSLLEQGHPFQVPASPRRYRYFDAVMLDIIERHSAWAVTIFTALFRRNPAERILRFLDEVATPGENALMIPSLPPRLLLHAVLSLNALGRV